MLKSIYTRYFTWLEIPSIHITYTDIAEIVILAFIVYRIMLWIRMTRAWTLLKGILMLAVFIGLAYFFHMNTIIFIAERSIDIALIAAIVIFHPELRRALEQLGQRKVFANLIPFDSGRDTSERFSDKTINDIVKASVEMGKVKTGALIVIEKDVTLKEYERTGIELDSILTSQLIINIFEHNTPLHDGAIIVRGNRIVAATCYLPLSDNMELSKELGTRHRAGVGISEATDSMTIIVSEETGHISIASKGKLMRNVSAEQLREQLVILQNKSVETKKFKLWKGKDKNEENNI